MNWKIMIKALENGKGNTLVAQRLANYNQQPASPRPPPWQICRDRYEEDVIIMHHDSCNDDINVAAETEVLLHEYQSRNHNNALSMMSNNKEVVLDIRQFSQSTTTTSIMCPKRYQPLKDTTEMDVVGIDY